MKNIGCLFNCPQMNYNKNIKSFCECNNEDRCKECTRLGKCKWCVYYDQKLKSKLGKCVSINEYNSDICIEDKIPIQILEYKKDYRWFIFILLIVLFLLFIYLIKK